MLRAHERLNLVAGASYTLRCQLQTGDGEWADSSTVVSMHAQIYRRGAADPTYSEFLSVAAVVLDEFVITDEQWVDDANDARAQSGYNFKWVIPGSAIPCADWYTVQLTSTDSQGFVTKVLFEGAARGSYAAPTSSSSSSSSSSAAGE